MNNIIYQLEGLLCVDVCCVSPLVDSEFQRAGVMIVCEGGMLVSFIEAKVLGPPPVGITLCVSLHINRFPYLFLSVLFYLFFAFELQDYFYNF